MWNEVTYPFPNSNGVTVEVEEWINNLIPHFTEHVMSYPCGDLSESVSVKGAPGNTKKADIGLVITGYSSFIECSCVQVTTAASETTLMDMVHRICLTLGLPV